VDSACIVDAVRAEYIGKKIGIATVQQRSAVWQTVMGSFANHGRTVMGRLQTVMGSFRKP